ncbi:MAG: hypothetical protein NVV59_03835, partial [Chitinophagaceae bacterium]|nr:hypothetical protein [Chitinophagaceae bacterium]
MVVVKTGRRWLNWGKLVCSKRLMNAVYERPQPMQEVTNFLQQLSNPLPAEVIKVPAENFREKIMKDFHLDGAGFATWYFTNG